MNNLIKNGVVKELNSTELKSIDGGNWLTEGVAYLAGWIHGNMVEWSKNNELDWSKQRVLVGG